MNGHVAGERQNIVAVNLWMGKTTALKTHTQAATERPPHVPPGCELSPFSRHVFFIFYNKGAGQCVSCGCVLCLTAETLIEIKWVSENI